MKTPVLIAARNEAPRIGRLLEHLPGDLVEPIVIANGCEDATAGTAREFGVTVIEVEQPGKLPALQEGMRYLADRSDAINTPVLFTDADSWPVFPHHWAESMLAGLETEHGLPSLSVGPVVYRMGCGVTSNTLRTVLAYARQVRQRNNHDHASWRGANMAVQFTSSAQLEQYLELPHYWPCEDHATADLVRALGGETTLLFNISAAIYTESRFAPNIVSLLSVPREVRTEHARLSYLARCAPGAVGYIPGSLSVPSEGSVQ